MSKGGWSRANHDATVGWGLDPARLRAIVNAPLVGELPPLSYWQNVRILVACYRANGYLIVAGEQVRGLWEMEEMIEKGKVQRGDQGTEVLYEAFTYLDACNDCD